MSAMLLQGVGFISELYTDSVDKQIREDSKTKDSILYPSIKGKSMGMDQLYIETIDDSKDNLIIYGNSTSILGVLEEETLINEQKNIIMASTGSASIEAMQIMKSYLDVQGIEQDEVWIDISPTTFQKRSKNSEVIVSALEYGNNYQVTDSLEVHDTLLTPVNKFFSWNARKIEKAIEYLNTRVTTGSYDALFEGSTFDYKGYEKTLSLDEERITTLISFSNQFNNPTIQLLYQNSEFQASESGVIYNNFVDEELVPTLLEEGYTIIDYRFDINDEYFVDNNHLNYKGRQIFTKEVEKEHGY